MHQFVSEREGSNFQGNITKNKVRLSYGGRELHIDKVEDTATLSVLIDGQLHKLQQLIVKKRGGKSHVYVDIKYNPLTLIQNLKKTEDSTGRTVYQLNSRGFLTFIALTKDKRKILDIISVASLLEEVPFLSIGRSSDKQGSM